MDLKRGMVWNLSKRLLITANWTDRIWSFSFSSFVNDGLTAKFKTWQTSNRTYVTIANGIIISCFGINITIPLFVTRQDGSHHMNSVVSQILSLSCVIFVIFVCMMALSSSLSIASMTDFNVGKANMFSASASNFLRSFL